MTTTAPEAPTRHTRILATGTRREWDDDDKDKASARIRTRFVASTDAPDRMGDIVDQSWRLDSYKDNPVILWAHRYDLPPVGKAVSVEVTEAGLEMEVEWDTGSEAGAQVARQFEEGFLSAGSVGFAPRVQLRRDQLDEDDPRKAASGYVFLDNELLEFSAVPVPANAQALAAKGLPAPSHMDGPTLEGWIEGSVRHMLDEGGDVEDDDKTGAAEALIDAVAKRYGLPPHEVLAMEAADVVKLLDKPKPDPAPRATLRDGILALLDDDEEIRRAIGKVAEARVWGVPDEDDEPDEGETLEEWLGRR